MIHTCLGGAKVRYRSLRACWPAAWSAMGNIFVWRSQSSLHPGPRAGFRSRFGLRMHCSCLSPLARSRRPRRPAMPRLEHIFALGSLITPEGDMEPTEVARLQKRRSVGRRTTRSLSNEWCRCAAESCFWKLFCDRYSSGSWRVVLSPRPCGVSLALSRGSALGECSESIGARRRPFRISVVGASESFRTHLPAAANATGASNSGILFSILQAMWPVCQGVVG